MPGGSQLNKRCGKCKGLLRERPTDWAKFGLKEPSMHKRNPVMECVRCGELWYDGKPDKDTK